MAIPATAVAILAFNHATRSLSPANGVLFINLVPLAPFAIEALRGHRPTIAELVGVALTFAAVIPNNLHSRRATKRPAPAAFPTAGTMKGSARLFDRRERPQATLAHMNLSLPELLEGHPVIASVKDDDGLKAVLDADCKVVFLLYGSVLDLGGIVRTLKRHGKIVLVNVDLLEGFSSKDVVVRYIKQHTEADGILSSKAPMVRAAREQGMFAVHRLFLIDSLSYENLPKQVRMSKPDCVEILPGCMPRVISWVVEDIDVPLIAGGLVCDREDVFAALKAGAAAIASSNRDVWAM